MKQPIAGYLQDEDGAWVARLACGHRQHVRHDPPWQDRAWVTTEEGRTEHLGIQLACKKCDAGLAPDDMDGGKDGGGRRQD